MSALLKIMLFFLLIFSHLEILYPQEDIHEKPTTTSSTVTKTSKTQVVPPTYWENYMSFKIGNYFEYEVNGGLYRYSRKIVGDTIVQFIGQHYYKIEYISPIPSPPGYLFERIDSSGDWYEFLPGTQQQCLLYRLNIPINSAYLYFCSVNYMRLVDTFSINSILGSTGPYLIRRYNLESLAPGYFLVSRKFQLYYQYNYEGGNYVNLVGAIIDSIVYGSVSGTIEEIIQIPTEYELFPNYPNPFNPQTVIKFKIPERAFIKLAVYNLMGQEVSLLYKGYIKPGVHHVKFNAVNLASGVYLYKLQSSKFSKTMKMILIK